MLRQAAGIWPGAHACMHVSKHAACNAVAQPTWPKIACDSVRGASVQMHPQALWRMCTCAQPTCMSVYQVSFSSESSPSSSMVGGRGGVGIDGSSMVSAVMETCGSGWGAAVSDAAAHLNCSGAGHPIKPGFGMQSVLHAFRHINPTHPRGGCLGRWRVLRPHGWLLGCLCRWSREHVSRFPMR